MLKDPILEEIHQIRDKLARKFDYDLDRIYADIKEKQEKDKAEGKKYLSLPPKRPKKEAA
jgi:hypothetical protein